MRLKALHKAGDALAGWNAADRSAYFRTGVKSAFPTHSPVPLRTGCACTLAPNACNSKTTARTHGASGKHLAARSSTVLRSDVISPAKCAALLRAIRVPIVLIAAIATSGCGDTRFQDSTGTAIGVLLPMTGSTASYGQDTWNGISLAVDEIRAQNSGSVDFRLVLADEMSSREQVAPQTKSLIEGNRAAVIIGDAASSHTMQAAIVCKEAQIPLVTPVSTNDDLTQDTDRYGNRVFRVCYKDSFQGTALARFARVDLKARSAVVLIDQGQAYSVGLGKRFEKQFTDDGGTTHTEYFTAGEKDYTTLVHKVAQRKPDVIAFTGYYPEAGAMLRAAKDVWAQVPVVGGDALDSEDLLPLAGDTKIRVFFTTHFSAEDSTPSVKRFVERYQAKYDGRVPGALAALGYDAMMTVWRAMEAARAKGPVTSDSISIALSQLDFTGVTGRIRMDEDRSPDKEIVIVEARGTFKFVTRLGGR